MNETQIKEALNEYKIAKRDLQAAINTIRELEAKSTATGSLAPKEVQIIASLPLSARFEQLIVDKVDLEAIVAEEQAYLEEARKNVMQLIELSANKTQRRLLICRYIHCMTFEQCSRVINYSLPHTRRIHALAIKTILQKMITYDHIHV